MSHTPPHTPPHNAPHTTALALTHKTGVLLLNVGTPDAPDTTSVRRYLREFLSDPRVLDINPLARFLLLNLIILPFRPAKSAAAYRSVWTPEGSPLLVISKAFARELAATLGPAYLVEPAMRYGNPSIKDALNRLIAAGADRIVVFPLYPQYSSSATGTSLERTFHLASQFWNVPSLAAVPPFYDDPAFLDAFASVGKPVIDDMRADHVLMSFHGLPQRHVKKSDTTGGTHCLATPTCCDHIVAANRNCYRAQCFATARGIAARLDLAPNAYSVAFQSRLGRDPWIPPYTDELLITLAKERGVKRLAVFCPAFIADCLETLEEIGDRARHDFLAAGGEDLRLIPSLNTTPAWVTAAADYIRAATFTH